MLGDCGLLGVGEGEERGRVSNPPLPRWYGVG